MDILELIDRLEDLFNESQSIPFTHSVIVNEDRMLDIIDQMRVSIPDEIKKAEQVTNQKERYLAQAQEEAARITSLARERSAKAVTQEEVVQEAIKQAESIILQAKAERDRLKEDTDQYIINSLQEFEKHLAQLARQVQNGITTVKEQSANR